MKNVVLGKGCNIGPGVFIGNDCVIGDGVTIYPNTFIGSGTVIGDGCLIYSNCSIYHGTTIGKGTILHSGCVIGSDGYGYILHDGIHYKILQVGNVVIGENVEIGANVTIDRGAIGSTIVGDGTKIDNLVHIAHNVKIGSNTLIVAQVGVAGSSEVGDYVTLAGQVGVVGHVKIGSGTTVAARSVVTGDIPENSFVMGFPAKPHKEEKKIKAALRKLPELLKTIKSVQKSINNLEE
jgi:UDP-3-O-[3-hydroxymyristoyl] glucosamine N-acyltransferase